MFQAVINQNIKSLLEQFCAYFIKNQNQGIYKLTKIFSLDVYQSNYLIELVEKRFKIFDVNIYLI